MIFEKTQKEWHKTVRHQDKNVVARWIENLNGTRNSPQDNSSE
jgi:hypothetical protein